jgi:hypothetical protein
MRKAKCTLYTLSTLSKSLLDQQTLLSHEQTLFNSKKILGLPASTWANVSCSLLTMNKPCSAEFSKANFVIAKRTLLICQQRQQTLLEPYCLGQTLFMHNKLSFSKGERTNKLCSCKQTPPNFAGAILPWPNFVHSQQTKFFQGWTHEQTLLMQANTNKLCWSHIALAKLCSFTTNEVFPPVTAEQTLLIKANINKLCWRILPWPNFVHTKQTKWCTIFRDSGKMSTPRDLESTIWRTSRHKYFNFFCRFGPSAKTLTLGVGPSHQGKFTTYYGWPSHHHEISTGLPRTNYKCCIWTKFVQAPNKQTLF